MNGWEAVLSNGDVLKENKEDICSWRWLRDLCQAEDLKIAELRYNDQQVYAGSDAYFAFFEAIGTYGSQFTKRAVGCIRQGDHGRKKVRVTWYNHETGQQIGPTEVHYLDSWESANIAQEFAVESVTQD